MSSHLARPGDLVRLDGLGVGDLGQDPGGAPGLVLVLDDGWAHVQWSDDAPQVDRFDAATWTQWHPRPKLTVISKG